MTRRSVLAALAAAGPEVLVKTTLGCLATLSLTVLLGCGAELDPLLQRVVTPAEGAESGGAHIEVFSAHATRIELWCFDKAADERPTARHVMTRGPNDVWTVDVAGMGHGALYGLRAWGPNWPYDDAWTPGSAAGFVRHVDAQGHRFNPNKLLLDPYARATTGDIRRVHNPQTGVWDYAPSVLGGTDEVAFLDSAGAMPKSVWVQDSFHWGADRAPSTPAHESVVYEVHLRGFTRADGTLPQDLRGTYDGFAERAGYLRDLGVTAVELLPVHEFLQYSSPLAGDVRPRTNYWGYMTHGFFAPNYEYQCADMDNCARAPGSEVAAFKRMVKALHAAGIEVWLDVVYNHTAEGGACPGTPLPYLSFRGLDDTSYYTQADAPGCYWDSTGTGNNLNAANPAVRRLIMDSLRYWIGEMRVDGFRFDLAYTLGRVGRGGRDFDAQAPLLREIAELGRSRGVKMVAEAWDTQGYGVGQFPDGWMEWNGLWRDNVRRFIKSEPAEVGGLGASASASHSGLPPAESINFVTAHDGFTMADLVAYNRSANAQGPCNPLGLDPGSGASDNDSWDHDGDELLQRQQLRNLMAQLSTHQGVPMLVAGDEMRRTQFGNNNAYMADNACGWLNWQDLTTHQGHFEFTRAALDMRATHPALGRPFALSGQDHDADGQPDLAWHGVWPDWPDWSPSSRSLAFTLDGSRQETGATFDAPDLYVAFNAYWRGLNFRLPNPPVNQCWFLVMDTAQWAEPSGNVWGHGQAWSQKALFPVQRDYYVAARSSLVLAARPCDAPGMSRVDFEVRGFVTQPGQTMAVVGSSDALGAWDPQRALPLVWQSTDRWRASHFFAEGLGEAAAFKFIVIGSDGQVLWEAGADRALRLPAVGQAQAQQGDWR